MTERGQRKERRDCKISLREKEMLISETGWRQKENQIRSIQREERIGDGVKKMI